MRKRLKSDEVGILYEKYSDIVFCTALMYLKNQEDAYDIVHNVYEKLLRKNICFKEEEHSKAWLLKVTHNACRDYLKSAYRKKRVSLEAQQEKGIVYSFCDGEKKEQYEDLFREIMDMPSVYRVVIYLYYFQGYKANEIGKIVGKSASAVRSRLVKARALLAESLKEEM